MTAERATTEFPGGPVSRELLESHDAASMAVLRCVLHDLGSPLAAMSANAAVMSELVEALGRGHGGTRSVDELEAILVDVLDATRRLAAIAADAQAYAHGQGGEAVDVPTLVEQALRLARAVVHRRVRVEHAPTAEPMPRLARSLVRSLARLLVTLTHDLEPSSAAKPTLSITVVRAPGAVLELRVAPHPGLAATNLRLAALYLGELGTSPEIDVRDGTLVARVALEAAP